jgi:hypothetical protein
MVPGMFGVDSDQFGRRDEGHLFGDERSPVAALRDIPIVVEALHQLDPRPRNAPGSQPVSVGSPEKPYPGNDGITRMECVRFGAARARWGS